MLTWQERPSEIANLLNPAFCALLLHDSIEDFYRESVLKKGIFYGLSFLILPIVLHNPTRDALPKTTAPLMSDWLQQTPQVLVGFADRTRLLVPFTKEAIVFGMHKRTLEISKEGYLIPGTLELLSTSLWSDEAEAALCIKSAKMLGRWLARSGDPKTIFRTWGVCP